MDESKAPILLERNLAESSNKTTDFTKTNKSVFRASGRSLELHVRVLDPDTSSSVSEQPHMHVNRGTMFFVPK